MKNNNNYWHVLNIVLTGNSCSGGLLVTGSTCSGGLVVTGSSCSGGLVVTGSSCSGGLVVTGSSCSGGLVMLSVCIHFPDHVMIMKHVIFASIYMVTNHAE